MVELQSLMPLAVVGFAVAMAMFAEFIQYIVVYRTPAYQRMKANLDKHASKVETAKDATSSALNVKKREAKLQEWQQEAGKLNAGVQFKSAVVTGCMLLLSFKLVPRVFGSVPVATLPFHPPGFIQSIAQRGLQDVTDPRACSPMFLFMLCQGSVKIIVGKLHGYGPTRKMQEAQVVLPKAFMKQS